MAQLIKCIECGKEMSSEARGGCPHCKTHYPTGRPCGVCAKTLRVSEGKSVDYSIRKTFTWNGVFGHAACLDEIKQCQYPCPVCKNLITTQQENYPDGYSPRCIKCGHPIKTNQCCYCGQYLIEDTAVELSSKEYMSKANMKGYDHVSGWFAHKICYSNRHSSFSCFIATAALGSSLAPEVTTLRTFRDNVLRNYHFGRRFIAVYESASPPLAHIIASNEILRYLTRFLIVYPAAQLAKLALKRSRRLD